MKANLQKHMGFKEQVALMCQDYFKENQKDPTTLYLRKLDEIEILKLNTNDIGCEAIAAIDRNGARGIRKFLGLEIVWDSKKFRVGDAKEMVLMEINKIEEKGEDLLHFYKKNVNELPAEIAKLTNLKQIILDDNKLTWLPPEIGQLTNLTRFILYSNRLAQLPAEIGQLANLKELNLGGNQLTQLSAEIGQLANLKELNLSDNQLTQLPAEIGQLANLTHLVLCNNQLAQLPIEIGQLINLKELFLSCNRLEQLPTEISRLTNLKELRLHKNQLSQNTIQELKKALPNCKITSDFEVYIIA